MSLNREYNEERVIYYSREQGQVTCDMNKSNITAYQSDSAKNQMFYCKSAVGNYVNPIMNLPWIFDEAYQEYFDKQGVYTESQIIRLKNKCPEAYRKYTKQENGKFICMF